MKLLFFISIILAFNTFIDVFGVENEGFI
jgi:hypothetical protein